MIHKALVYRNAITQDICPDRSEAVHLGPVTPNIVNRMPENMDSLTWTRDFDEHPVNLAGDLINVPCLIHWKPDLNFHDLLPDFIDHPTARLQNCLARVLAHPQTLLCEHRLICILK